MSHLNIQPSHKNFDSSQEFLCLLPHLPHIICLSKTRLNFSSLTYIDLPGYKLLHTDSTTRAGAVAVYFSICLNADNISIIDIDIDECENLWIKVNDPDIVIELIYRHTTNNSKLFVKKLNKIY